MQVTLRYFAMIRETIGKAEEERTIPAGTTAGALFDAISEEYPRLRPMKRATMLMVNQAYVPASQPLQDGDEVAFIPPVSGGSAQYLVTTEPLDPRAVEEIVASDAAGAIVTFTGTVRGNARGQAVTALDYEAYAPAAEKMLAQIGNEIDERWQVEGTAMHHRTGRLGIGEISVVIAVAAAHRDEAFAACHYAIERIKAIVPIWKKEFYTDGAVWIGSEADYQREIGRLTPEQ